MIITVYCKRFIILLSVKGYTVSKPIKAEVQTLKESVYSSISGTRGLLINFQIVNVI